MSKGDEFREKYYAAIDNFLIKDNRNDLRFAKAWTKEFATANIKEIKEYLAPFATTLEQIIERVNYDIGKQKSKKERKSIHKL